jgi:hypothetical protein
MEWGAFASHSILFKGFLPQQAYWYNINTASPIRGEIAAQEHRQRSEKAQ